jgi:ribosomal protein L33
VGAGVGGGSNGGRTRKKVQGQGENFTRGEARRTAQDRFGIKKYGYVCHETVSTYDTAILSPIFNYMPHQRFCLAGLYDTTYGTSVVASLRPFTMHWLLARYPR